MKKKITRFLGYLFFAVFLYMIFLVSLFPSNSLRPLISAEIKKSTGANVRIDSLSLGLPARVSILGVTFLEDNGREIYRARSIELSLGLLSLLRLSPQLNYLVTGQGATLKGVVNQGDGKYMDLHMVLNSKSPHELLRPLKNAESISLNGDVEVRGRMKIPLKALEESRLRVDSIESVKLDFNLRNMEISLPEVPVKALSDFSFTRIEGSLSMVKGQVGVDFSDIEGDLSGSVKGKVVIMNPLINSRLDIRSKFKPSDSLIKRAGSFLSILSRKKGPLGVYTLDIKGSFLKPLPII